MRKSLLLCSFVVALCADAAVISPEAALKRAVAEPVVRAMAASSAASASPVLVYTENYGSQPAAYLFDRGRDNGYLVVSADDDVTPLLGYADSGSVDISDMPDGLRYWLGYYAAEIDAVRNNRITQLASDSSVVRSAIAPMLATRWNQGTPYNDRCPMIDSVRCVTGCVATAMAQVMKYHNWPAKGTGTHSYGWNGQTLTIDFSTITYDWPHMVDEYGTDNIYYQRDAVASLMYSCGVAVDMNYGTDESGAVGRNCGSALVDYFSYDGSLRYLERDYYTLSDWEDEVYASLADGCPVLYGGQSLSGGHEFVCDGYSSDGYFHFNWGWDGLSDGYFLLTALNPESQGIGGAGNGAGFNFSQEIIVGIKPFAGQADFEPVLVNNTDFAIEQPTSVLGSDITVAVQLSNTSYGTVSFLPGLSFTDDSGNTVYAVSSDPEELSLTENLGYSSASAFDVTLPASLTDGVYTVSPAFISDGKWYGIATELGKVNSVTMTVAGGNATFSSPVSGILPQVTDYAFESELYAGMDLAVNGTVENTSELEFYGRVYVMLISPDRNTLLPSIQMDIPADSAVPFSYSTKLSSGITPGEYQFVFVTITQSGYQEISSLTDITVNAAPASTELTLGPVSFISGSNHLPKDDLGVKTSLTCVTGAYYGTLDMLVFRNVGGDEWKNCASYPSGMLYLEAGETADVVYDSDFSAGIVGETYMLMFYHGDERFDTHEMIVLDASTGITQPEADAAVDRMELYTLDGRLVSGKPLPGLYIIVWHTADGNVSTGRLLVK